MGINSAENKKLISKTKSWLQLDLHVTILLQSKNCKPLQNGLKIFISL